MKNNFDDIYYPNNLEEILYKNVDEKMVDHIKRPNKDYLDTIAQTLFDEKATYRELFDNIAKCAMALKTYGVSKGDCVTFAMPNIPETIYYFYACNEIGATAYLIDPRSSFNSMVDCIKQSNSCLFICEMGNYYEKVANNIDKLPVDNVVVVSPVNMLQERKKLNSGKDYLAAYLYSLKKFYNEMKLLSKDTSKNIFHKEFMNLANQFTGNYSEEYDPDIPAIIVNTSGTTGVVKGAIHSNRNYNIFTNQIHLITKELVRGNSYYSYVPYCAMYGSCVGMHTALTNGIIIHNAPKFKGKKALEEIIDKKVSIIVGVPNLIESLADMYEDKNLDASHVKQYVIGGDNASPETIKRENEILLSRGMSSKIIFGYGATEALPIATTNFDERSQVPGSTGIPYPGVSIKIINPETFEEMPDYSEGEIYAHTPNMMIGYLNKEENKSAFKEFDGLKYYKTGDKGYKTENGILFLTGRYKRLMKRPDGHQTSPIPIENALRQNSKIKDCAAVGIKRKEGKPGLIPTAFIVLENNEEIKKQDIMKETIISIAEDVFQTLSGERENALAYVVVDKIPMTINGKVDFVKLSEKTFDEMEFYALDDIMVRDYFENMPNVQFIKISKGKTKTLNKK